MESAAKWRELIKLTESMKRKLRAVRFAMSSSMKLLEKIRVEEDAIKDEQLEQVNNGDNEENLGLQFAEKLLSHLRKDYEVALKAKRVAETEWRDALIKLTEFRAQTPSWWTMKGNPEQVQGKRREISRGPVVTGARFGTGATGPVSATGATGPVSATGATGPAFATGVTGTDRKPRAITGVRRPRGPITTGSKHDDLSATASTGTVESATEESVLHSIGGMALHAATASTGTEGATAVKVATGSTGSAASAVKSATSSTGGATAVRSATASTGSAAVAVKSMTASTGGAVESVTEESVLHSIGEVALHTATASTGTGGATAAKFATGSTGSAASAVTSVTASTGVSSKVQSATAGTGATGATGTISSSASTGATAGTGATGATATV